ncbi:hypothetical protein [Flavobacterium aquatile]|uniref:Cell wall anchor protein n=1 Tax=Flavobacterium aquatile LMG 4008 = ATCC 11947 TaxID=1453498 RepID=A0A095V2W1_9FLAO|nr:hypothetical protein [Flavobacterium aquatile]KGD69155.1 hypothetical protein LG45_05860 [Flavobacterium aquatile LMG 4008 = ATCC 11947]OXA65864.1 hypothetical protein B0A61_14590 [Flavobacterium aquatile LMG 4008 = ATCC 11947]GEC79679.1 hypothetical protein FAQ01_25490 [Flavobacterium aquatile]
MKKITFGLSFWTTLLLLCVFNSQAQVGIGTVTPDTSSMMDVSSTTKGFLTPRMTTTERNAIASPADGLIVYDVTLKSFYHYNTATSTWVRINSEVNGRLKFKRIKSTDVLATVLAAEKTAGSNTKYLLDANTYYEINGTILVDLPIDLNNAYLVGLDANEDVLSRSGNLFVGATGGTIKNITISVPSGNVFTLSGANTENFLVRDCIIANCSNVGSISGFGLVFFAIVQYSGNTTGITYNNITRLLLSNTAWFGNNAGTFEKYTGTFSLIQKQGGFCEVNGTAIGVDVSTAGLSITGDAVMETVVFTGTLSTGKYVKGYSPATYSGYNFNNSWTVRCAGIPVEADATSTGNLYKSSLTGVSTIATVLGTNYKVQTTSTSTTNLFRFESTTTGRLTYKGKKTRAFQANASLSFQENVGSTNTDYVFFFAKISANGSVTTPLPETETYIDTNSGFVQAFPISGTITLAEGESVELFLRRVGSGNRITISTLSYNLSLK